MKKSHKIAFCGMMTALAIVLGYLEHLIPFSVGIYGIKLGLANLSIVCLLYLTDFKSALAVHTVRILATGLLFGNGVSLIYSTAGGLFSFLVMTVLKRWTKLGIVGISICGGVSHNLAQLIAAICLMEQLRIAFYFPVLLLSGTVAGLVIGICSLPIVQNRALRRWCEPIPAHQAKEKGKIF